MRLDVRAVAGCGDRSCEHRPAAREASCPAHARHARQQPPQRGEATRGEVTRGAVLGLPGGGGVPGRRADGSTIVRTWATSRVLPCVAVTPPSCRPTSAAVSRTRTSRVSPARTSRSTSAPAASGGGVNATSANAARYARSTRSDTRGIVRDDRLLTRTASVSVAPRRCRAGNSTSSASVPLHARAELAVDPTVPRSSRPTAGTPSTTPAIAGACALSHGPSPAGGGASGSPSTSPARRRRISRAIRSDDGVGPLRSRPAPERRLTRRSRAAAARSRHARSRACTRRSEGRPTARPRGRARPARRATSPRAAGR